MPQAVDEAGNIWETDAAGRPVRFIGKQQAGPRVQKIGGPDPLAVNRDNRAAAAAERAASASEAATTLAQKKFIADLYEKGLQPGPNGTPVPIPGWTPPTSIANRPILTAKERADAIAGYKSAEQLDQTIADMERLYQAGPGSTSGLAGVQDFLPSEANKNFDAAGNAARGIVGQALGFTGGQLNTATEANMAVGPYLPQSGNYDETILQKIARLKQLSQAARDRSIAILGGVPDANGQVKPVGSKQTVAPAIIENNGTQKSARAVGTGMEVQPGSTIATGNTESIPVPPAMLAGLEGYLRARRGQQVDNQDFAAFYNDLAKRNNYPGGTPESLNTYIKQFNETGAIGPVTPAKKYTGALQQLYNDVATTPWGTRTIRSANALAGGIPEMLGGNQARQGLSQLAEQNPMSAFIGDTAGAIAGTAGLVKGLNALGATLPKALAAGNIGYGGIYGASQNPENPLAGAAIGAMASGAGELAGSYVAAPILEALGRNTLNPVLRFAGRPGFSEAPAISRPERTIINTVGDQGRAVTNMLGEASTLGVPMTLADTTEALRSLGGAVARRSPEARGMARDVMEPRALGQIDRLQGAISRDFGDPTNVLERSDMLLKQAQANSRPLYNEAFQAPGASSVDAADILATPAGKTALARARTQMLNDRKDPSALGIDINDAGEPVLSSVPSFETLDYVKKGFDDIANEGRTPFGTFQPNADQASAANLSAILRSRIDEVNPAYAQARAAYAGPAAEREALQMGKTAIGQPAENIAYTLKNMPTPRQQQYRLGALSGLSERANNARFSTNPFDVVAGSPEAQNRLRALFSENAARFIEQANLERQLAKSNNQIIGGSPTALNQQADQAFGLPTGATLAIDGASAMLAGAPPVATGARLLGGMSKDAFKLGLGKKRADELAPILFSPDAAAAAAAFRELQKNVRRKGVYEAAKKRRKGIFGSLGGGASAAAVSNEKQ